MYGGKFYSMIVPLDKAEGSLLRSFNQPLLRERFYKCSQLVRGEMECLSKIAFRRSAFRSLWRAGIRAAHWKEWNAFRELLRSGFRLPERFWSDEWIANTLRFLETAGTKKHSIEHRLLRNICRIEHHKKFRQPYASNSRRIEERPLIYHAYDQYDKVVYLVSQRHHIYLQPAQLPRFCDSIDSSD
ncbi:DUF1763 family protein [Schizosaccharomyces japonicus yFS275]|uniref:DUF1763 family protein n=1 Tax=Schizosaccharomyces japonicus (strain yFS275 / FY16936) TaxID=402676 RepID=T0T6K2_SCHJY|nr:DUF1763 family protein [Schizosaccharomyces japonicus yFS275]EQC53059.1 DUF1763 family protein [Schizosaccharomyces japonicus yFS275]